MLDVIPMHYKTNYTTFTTSCVYVARADRLYFAQLLSTSSISNYLC